MAFDFPASPTAGQEYTPSGGPTYVWESPRWKAKGFPATMSISDTPPASPLVGQLWYESDSGNMFIWYDDGTSQQWVQVNVAPPNTNPATAQTRNRIVNGAFQISQEHGSTPVSGYTVYPADEWGMYTGLPGTVAARQDGGSYFQYTQSFNIVTASPAAADYCQHIHFVEGNRVADFGWGTADAKPAVLRCEMSVDLPGIYGVSVINAAGDRSFVKGVDVLGTAWQTVVIPISAMTTGTWPTGNTPGLSVRFCTVGGTSQQGVDGWQNSTKLTIPGQVNTASQINKNLRIRNVGLYLDPDATGLAPPWQTPDPAEELRACQRYFYRKDSALGGFTNFPAAGVGTSATGIIFVVPHPVRMRTLPAFASSNVTTTLNPTATGLMQDVPGIDTSRLNMTLTSGGVTQYAYNLQASNTTAAYLIFNARM